MFKFFLKRNINVTEGYILIICCIKLYGPEPNTYKVGLAALK